eukprot:scaffold99757_cov75-Phaeocystis_antarctica.AAC.2
MSNCHPSYENVVSSFFGSVRDCVSARRACVPKFNCRPIQPTPAAPGAFLMPEALPAMLLKNRAILQLVDVNWRRTQKRAEQVSTTAVRLYSMTTNICARRSHWYSREYSGSLLLVILLPARARPRRVGAASCSGASRWHQKHCVPSPWGARFPLHTERTGPIHTPGSISCSLLLLLLLPLRATNRAVLLRLATARASRRAEQRDGNEGVDGRTRGACGHSRSPVQPGPAQPVRALRRAAPRLLPRRADRSVRAGRGGRGGCGFPGPGTRTEPLRREEAGPLHGRAPHASAGGARKAVHVRAARRVREQGDALVAALLESKRVRGARGATRGAGLVLGHDRARLRHHLGQCVAGDVPPRRQPGVRGMVSGGRCAREGGAGKGGARDGGRARGVRRYLPACERRQGVVAAALQRGAGAAHFALSLSLSLSLTLTTDADL